MFLQVYRQRELGECPYVFLECMTAIDFQGPIFYELHTIGCEARSAIGSYGKSDRTGERDRLRTAIVFHTRLFLLSRWFWRKIGWLPYNGSIVPPSVGVGISLCSDRANSESANAHTIGNGEKTHVWLKGYTPSLLHSRSLQKVDLVCSRYSN